MKSRSGAAKSRQMVSISVVVFMDGVGIALAIQSRSALPLSTGHFFGLHSQQQQQQGVAGLGCGLDGFFMVCSFPTMQTERRRKGRKIFSCGKAAPAFVMLRP